MSARRLTPLVLSAALVAGQASCAKPQGQHAPADTLGASAATPQTRTSTAVLAPALPAPGALCPASAHPDAPEELIITETEFSEVRFENGFAYFDNDLARDLADSQLTTAITDREGFWIGYRNSLTLMKGFMLKQAALLEQAAGRPDSALLADSSSARFRFCEFLKSTAWVD